MCFSPSPAISESLQNFCQFTRRENDLPSRHNVKLDVHGETQFRSPQPKTSRQCENPMRSGVVRSKSFIYARYPFGALGHNSEMRRWGGGMRLFRESRKRSGRSSPRGSE
ncbi:hypothetical protein AVEN_134206-1 [Araneus ventricosus]|uniref:Uncharacterized protein n=1 Tax=Araneus ventricosus TaxID=182803 RepID=A0A4Y2EMS3_ARAVE|nr:hypothetical protein AVEN_134206-1 [Araneus ventricosus]